MAKSALSIPAESWTEIVTRSFPAPPLPKLLFWKLKAEKENSQLIRQSNEEFYKILTSFRESVFIRNVMNGIDDIERIGPCSVEIRLDGWCLSGVLGKDKV